MLISVVCTSTPLAGQISKKYHWSNGNLRACKVQVVPRSKESSSPDEHSQLKIASEFPNQSFRHLYDQGRKVLTYTQIVKKTGQNTIQILEWFFKIMAGVSLFFVCIWFLNWCIAQLEDLLSRKRWRPLLGYRRMSKNCSRVQFV